MKNKTIYGILFASEVINERNVLLKPYFIVEGNVSQEGFLIDKFEKSYGKVCMSKSISDCDQLYGFQVSEEELIKYFKLQRFPESQTDYPEICANLYLEFTKRFCFILEKSIDTKDSSCYAIDLKTKKTTVVDINRNIMEQLYEKIMISPQEEQNSETSLDENNIYNTKEILTKVKSRVVGQDEAASMLVGTVCKNLRYRDCEGMKTNVLLYGPTGCGKTELVRSLEKAINVPLIIEDLTPYTASGYVGDSVKKILRRLYNACGQDIKKTESGIIVLDEFDKLATINSDGPNKTDVQEELLKMIEGGIVDINDSNKTDQQLLIDTTNIIFILCGAFSKFFEKNDSSIGFCSQSLVSEGIEMSNKNLINYGVISELVGRVPIKIPIKKLNTEDYKQLLTSSSISCLRVYEQALLKVDKVRVVYENKEDFINKVAMKASSLDVGARGLKTVIDETFLAATNQIGEVTPHSRELFISSTTVDDPNAYVLKKVRGDKYELSKRVG